jgi:hypothetical protein
MGILDEAIREHLELKRRRGATDSELQRLEDEAFGPPSRPGEPDFPESEGEPAEQSGNGRARDDAVAAASVAPDAPVPSSHEGEGAERPGEPEEQDAAEAQTAIYDEGPGGELELGELDLERDVEGPAHEPMAPEEPGGVEESEPPIEALDTVEHELPEAERAASPEEPDSEEPVAEEHAPERASEPEQQEPSAPTESEETSGERESRPEEDVLADTPEFLRDAPEDDELWFEQGKPKDFDF